MSQYQHCLDASTEIWMRGGNPDRLSHDRSDNDYYDGRSPEQTARWHMREERDRTQRIRDHEREEMDYIEFHSFPPDEEPTNEPCNTDDLPF